MKRITSAPANIALMVNRKKDNYSKKIVLNIINNNKNNIINSNNNKNNNKNNIINSNNNILNKNNNHNDNDNDNDKLKNLKTKVTNIKFAQRTFNNFVYDYINHINYINNEEKILISIVYYYLSEKICTKKNIKNFILFNIEILIRYFMYNLLPSLINNIISNDKINKDIFLHNIDAISNELIIQCDNINHFIIVNNDNILCIQNNIIHIINNN